VFYVGHVDKSSLYETLFHCNILSKHHLHDLYTLGDEDEDGGDEDDDDYDNDDIDDNYENDQQFFSHAPISPSQSPTRSILKLVSDGKYL
jgi:hypothetical protein